MYGASKALLEFLGDRDVVVVVDDWFGGGGADGRLCFMGRAFYRRDHERTSDLVEALARHGAAAWHGRLGLSLFRSEGYSEVIEALERCASRMFTMNRDQQAFRAEHFDDAWRAIRESEIGDAWNTNAPQAKALMAFISRLRLAMERELPGGLKYRIILDRLDWMKRPKATALPLEHLGSTDRFDIWSLYDKDAEACAKYLPMLGLVDSEAWAWGRFQTRPLPNGGTFGERALAWRSGGRGPEPLVEPGEITKVLQDAGPNLADYWERSAKWSHHGRAVELHER